MTRNFRAQLSTGITAVMAVALFSALPGCSGGGSGSIPTPSPTPTPTPSPNPNPVGRAIIFNSATGHAYQIVEDTTRDWESARAYALTQSTTDPNTSQTLNGHLAVIDNDIEQAYLISIYPSNATPNLRGLFLGGYQTGSPATPTDGWNWVAATAWNGSTYINWHSSTTAAPPYSEPNNFQSLGESKLQFTPFDGRDGGTYGSWNDLRGLAGDAPGFLIEYEPSAPPV